jgi:choline dehydrogenase-like flavoprotein
VHGTEGLFVNDASLLCTAPGVNPQGTIMALARRNVLRFLNRA